MKRIVLAIIVALVMAVSVGCASYDFEATGEYIVKADDALAMISDGAILVDVQAEADYAASHIAGAINIPMAALTTEEPYSNMLPDSGQIESVMGAAGVTENTTILVYDCTANMQAARVQWTLNYYNNFNVKVVSGGLEALVRAGAQTSTEAAVLPETEYQCGDKQRKLLVNYDYIQSLLNTPEEGTVIIDTRSDEEYYEGTIPGSIHIEYTWNNYASGEYMIPRDIQSTYLGKDIYPEMKIILFCKTSVRAAQTYSALKDAGYQDVRVYDGAWLEYIDLQDPATAPETTTVPTVQDAS